MKTKRILITTLLVLTFLVSCKKTPQHIGNSLQPNSSFIHVAFSGDQDIVSEVCRVDSLSTKSASLSLVGNLNDPHFGNSNLSFYSQIGLTSNSLTWEEGATTDSIVLQLLYAGYYGDTLTPLTLRIHEVTESLTGDSMTYYSNTSFEVGDELANYTFQPTPRTKVELDDSLSANVIQIPIYNSLGDKFINSQETGFTSNDAFMNYFKGIRVSCEQASGTGSICYFNLLNTNSFLRIYYHTDHDTTFYDFNVSDKYVRFNHFEHDYNTAQAPITFNDTTFNEYIYVQSTAGVRSRIQFPELAQWAEDQNTNILINEAKLTLTGANGLVNGINNDTATFTQPIQLVVVKAKEDGSYSLLPDQLVGTNYFGGYYEPETDQVWFRISEYVQDLILAGPNAEDYGLYIYTYSGAFNAKRWIMHGPNSPEIDKRIKLDIIYSKIED